MPIKYSIYDSSSGNNFALNSLTGISGEFQSEITSSIYKSSGNVVVISGSGDVKPYGLFSFPNVTGSSGTVLQTNTDGTTTWTTGITRTYNEYSGNGTWNKPSGVGVVYVELIGGGGGGGAGVRAATTGTARKYGGGGGAGGVFVSQFFDATLISGTVNVTVGAGGSGGIQTTVDNTSGASGTNGGESLFGDYLTSSISSGGPGGPIAVVALAASGGVKGLNLVTYAVGGGISQTAGLNGASTLYGGAGGGGGGGFISGATASGNLILGGSGGFNRYLSTTLTNAASNTSAAADEGGGGGGGDHITMSSGFAGGNGAFPGGGGGGGGGSITGFIAGAGGDGAGGVVRIWTW